MFNRKGDLEWFLLEVRYRVITGNYKENERQLETNLHYWYHFASISCYLRYPQVSLEELVIRYEEMIPMVR